MRSALIYLFLLGCYLHILVDIEFTGIDGFPSYFMTLPAHLSVLMFAEANVSQERCVQLEAFLQQHIKIGSCVAKYI